MSTSYTCDQKALLKVLLHAAKYPAASVNGILLGFTASDRKTVEVVDAIPLLHSFLTLAPALETALVQVSYVHGCCQLDSVAKCSPAVLTEVR